MTLNQTGKHCSSTEFKPISLAYMIAYVLVQGKQQIGLVTCPSVMIQIISSMISNVYIVVNR